MLNFISLLISPFTANYLVNRHRRLLYFFCPLYPMSSVGCFLSSPHSVQLTISLFSFGALLFNEVVVLFCRHKCEKGPGLFSLFPISSCLFSSSPPFSLRQLHLTITVAITDISGCSGMISWNWMGGNSIFSIFSFFNSTLRTEIEQKCWNNQNERTLHPVKQRSTCKVVKNPHWCV